MPAYIVTYDLHTPGQKYTCLKEKLEAYGYYCHLQQSVWIVVSSNDSASIRDNLATCLDSNDSLFVAKLSGEAAWRGFSEDVTKWLKTGLNQ